MDERFTEELAGVLNRITELEEKQNNRNRLKARLNKLVKTAKSMGEIKAFPGSHAYIH